MDFDQFSSDIPSQNALLCFSPEQNEEVMRQEGVTQVVRQLSRGAFRCSVAQATITGADLVSDRFNVSMSTSLEFPKDTLSVLVPRSPTGEFRACGEVLSNENLIIIPGGTEIDIVSRGMVGSDTIIFDRSCYLRLHERLSPESSPYASLQSLKSSAVHLNVIRQMIVRTVIGNEPAPDNIGASELLVSMMVRLNQRSDPSNEKAFSFNPQHRKVAKVAQEYIESNFREAIAMDALCAVTGAGVRDLQRCFRKYFDTTFSEYLKMVRLDAVHRKLVHADLNVDSVTSIATEHGFTQLGRFSGVYKDMYGELPSETLRGNSK